MKSLLNAVAMPGGASRPPALTMAPVEFVQIGAAMIVWRIRLEPVRTVLCSVMYCIIISNS